MSYLTEYFDNYREHPIRKLKPFNKIKFPQFEGTWKDPKSEIAAISLSDEEIKAFIAKTMKDMRSQSEYYNGYCAHWPEDLKTREFVPIRKKRPPCDEKRKTILELLDLEVPKAMPLKEAEIMKQAKAIFERDINEPTLKPLETHYRIYGYVRPSNFKTGLSEYTDTYSRLAYEVTCTRERKP